MKFEILHTLDAETSHFLQKKGTVFTSEKWMNLYGNKLKLVGIYQDHKLIGVFQIYLYSKGIFKFNITPPFSPNCSLILSSEADKHIINTQLQNWFIEFHKTGRYTLSQLFFPTFLGTKTTPTESQIKAQIRQTFILNLNAFEDISEAYAPKRRQQLRRAKSDGLQVHELHNKQILLALISKTYQRQNKSIDQEFIRKIVMEFATENNSFAYVTYHNDKPSVAYFCVYDQHSAYYLLGGYDNDNKHIAAGPLAMHACIKHAKGLGLQTFDFEGSMEPSIAKYFKEFGGERTEYLGLEIRSKGSKIFDLAKSILKR